MAHFAYVVDGAVRGVHVVNNDVITDSEGVEQESLGQEFLAELYNTAPENFIQCSYHGSIRGVYPAAGYLYDSENDVFVAPVTVDPSEV